MTTAAILAAVFLWALATLPPRPLAAAGTVDDDVCRRTVAGAYHVHSTRSDGTGDVEAIAAAASRAGLRFVIMTDHGDGTRPIEPPRYRSGVLVIEAVEISTAGGHYVALDMPVAPYPLAGEAEAVVEDVARLGGFGVAAHPFSKKPELAWKDWTVPIDGLEWINMDSEWRDERRAELARVASRYPLRRGPVVASLLDRPVDTLERWDREIDRKPLVGLAGHDAHGGTLEGGSGGARRLLGIPSYEASFRTFAVRAIVNRELTGAAEEDARLVVDAIRRGHVFTAIDAIAGPAFVDFRAIAGTERAAMGETIPFERGARVEVHSTVPIGGSMVLIRSGTTIAETTSDTLSVDASEPGAYRVEVLSPSAPGTPPVPWVVTNPIYLRGQATDYGPRQPQYEIVQKVATDFRVEKDPESTATISAGSDGTLALDYALRAGDRRNQYVALVRTAPRDVGEANGFVFDVRSSSPMRISVQVRFDGAGGARWARSVYSSPNTTRVVAPFARFLPVDAVRNAPPLGTASSILFVVDLTNARPGQSGRFEISNLALAAIR